MCSFSVVSLRRDCALVRYGGLSFQVEIFEGERGLIVTKPRSFYVDPSDFRDLVSTVKQEWRREFSDHV